MALVALVSFEARAQYDEEVTYEEYLAATAAIEAGATYRIFTLNNGSAESSEPYFLTDGGWLINDEEEAGSFTFHKIETSGLFMPVSWQVDQFFTNPDFYGGGSGTMMNLGYLRSHPHEPGLQRDNYESQVWYKRGDTFAVRATNTIGTQWGANTFWNVTDDWDKDGLPNADYALTPQFTWRLEKIADAPEPEDPLQKEVTRLTNLPHVYINTFTGRSITSKDNYVYACMWYVDEEDNVTFYDSLQIRGRGNSTWGLAKKPYKLKFHEKEKLLGKGYAKTKKWTLLANHGDKTLIRNAVSSLMGERLGLQFNPAFKFVDFTLNDQYVGNYQISDQVDVRPHRVNITEQDAPLTEESDITGGYLFESDGSGDYHTSAYWDNDEQRYLEPDGFKTMMQNVPIRIHYPEAEDLEAAQVQYAKDFLADFEDRLFLYDFDDESWTYRNYVDSASLANWYLCTEISGNVDGFYSTYFYKNQQDDHLYWGPLWDYDIAYNNDNRDRSGAGNNTQNQLMTEVGYGNLRQWINRMWEDPWFARLINRRFQEVVNDGLEDYLNVQIDSLVQLIDASQQLNYERWGIDVRTLRERVLYSTYDQYISDLRNYINQHLLFLNDAFAALAPDTPEPGPDPVQPPKEPDFVPDTLAYYAISNLGTQTVLDVLSDDAVCCNSRDEYSELQQWRIILLSNGYLQLVNRASGLALNDPTDGDPTATTLVGSTLNVAVADSLDTRQQWDLVLQGNDCYNLINRFSDHAANLSGGNAADGTKVLSYTNNERNATSNNRLWTIEAVDYDPEPMPTGIESLDYALAYDPTSGRLHFGADDLSKLTFTVNVYAPNGYRIRSFVASSGTNLSDLPRGIYLISWKYQGHNRTVKLSL